MISRLPILLIAAVLLSVPSARATDDPGDRWVHAFVLLQTGRQLAKQDLWPLAQANYTTSLHYFERLAKDYPEFQPELVSFRIDDLKNRIAEAHESMNQGDHDIAMHYADFLEISNQGEQLRYDLQFAEAYPFLVRSRSLIDDLVEIRPEQLGPALAKQRDYLAEIIGETRDVILGKADGARMLNEVEQAHFLAGAVTLLELPENPDVTVSSALFPETF